MQYLMDFLQTAWSFQFSILPVIVAFFAFEGVTIIRRVFRIAYTPIYFLLFPLGHSDDLYAQYFNEDEFHTGETLSPHEKSIIRRKIVSQAIFSIAFSTVLNPFICGIFCAFFLSDGQYDEFFYFLLIYKTITLIFSIYNTRYISFVENSGSRVWLLLIYATYFIVILIVLNNAYDWSKVNLLNTDILLSSEMILEYIVIDLGIYIFLSGAVGWAISHTLTNPDLIPEPLDDVEDREN